MNSQLRERERERERERRICSIRERMRGESACAVELFRFAQVKRLRHEVLNLIRSASTQHRQEKKLVLVYERWLHRAMLSEDGVLEALLPTGAREALRDELTRAISTANEDDKDIESLTDRIMKASRACVSRLKDFRIREEEKPSLEQNGCAVLAVKRGNLVRMSLKGKEKPYFTISSMRYEKLKRMYIKARRMSMHLEQKKKKKKKSVTSLSGRHEKKVGEEKEEYIDSDFKHKVFCLIVRYDALGGSGYHAAISGECFRILASPPMNVQAELFASPLNSTLGHFCSAFGDTDTPFGSLGSFFDCVSSLGAGCFEVNPPFVEDVIARVIDALIAKLRSASRPICFVVVLPEWRDTVPNWSMLEEYSQQDTSIRIRSVEHGYVDGALWKQGRVDRGEEHRVSSYDTKIFFLRGGGAASVPSDVRTKIEHAMRRARGPQANVKELEQRFRKRKQDEHRASSASQCFRHDNQTSAKLSRCDA